MIQRISTVMDPVLTLNAFGRPVDWQVDDVLISNWGTVKVYCGTEDVTNFRGIQTEVREHHYTEPFEYGPAVVAFPQISPYDHLGVGDLDWFVQGMNLTLKKLWPDGETETTLWEGLTASWEPEYDPKGGYRMVLHGMGALHQTILEPMPPQFNTDLMDIGEALKECFDTTPARRFATFPEVTTTRGTRLRGSWESRLDYAQTILSTAFTADGSNQWTIGCNPGRYPTLHQKNKTTTHWHVSNNAVGVALDEKSDITATVDVIFGEGIALNGGRWRNSRYPDEDSGNPPVFVPLAYVSDNMPYTYDGEGNPTANPSFDPDRLRVARYENYGADISLGEGVESALAELARDVNPGWFGELRLIADPEEGSRLEIRAGQNIGVRHHHGDPVRMFHIADVAVDWKASPMTVTLTVDTNFRDSITLAGIRARDREAATDPARRLNPPRRRSKQTFDEKPIFDAESGAGIIPATALSGGQWNIVRVPASRYGTINATAITTHSSETRFVVGVFGKPVSVYGLGILAGDTGLTLDWDTNADSLSDAGLQMAWGDHTDLAGYWPHSGSDTPTPSVTGRLVDDGSWDFVSEDPPWLYLAIYPEDDCNLTGQLFVAPDA